jgi:hypothetical protein
MKFTQLVPQENEVHYVQIDAPVRYGDRDIPYDAPLRSMDMWKAIVDVHTGAIQDWPAGQSLDLEMKVADSGRYALLGENFEVIAHHQNYYVPHCTIPGSYGDYIKLDIDSSGVITNWKPDGSFDGFRTDGDD